MTTLVTIKNNGPGRVNVNEVETQAARKDVLIQSHTVPIGAEVTVHVWGANRFLYVLETNDVDTPEDKLTGETE